MTVAGKPVRAIVFDLFDTLVDLRFSRLPRAEIDGRAVPSTLVEQHRAVVERGHAIDLRVFAATLRESDRELRRSHLDRGREVPTTVRFSRVVDRLGIRDGELPDVLTRAHMAAIRSVAETPSHHPEVVRALAERYRLGLCSNFSHAATAREILAGAGLGGLFASLTISEAVGVRKPSREIFLHVLGELEATPADAVHVGDDLEADVRGASALGMRTIWVDRRVRDRERALAAYDGPAPTWVVRDLSALGGLLSG